MHKPTLEDAFEDIIGKARFGLGWSLSYLADRAGLSENRISDLEQGALPDRAEVDRIAAPLGLDKKKLAFIAENTWTPKQEYPSILFQDKTSEKGSIYVIDGKIGTYPVNGYLFIDGKRKEAVLFDTGYSPERVIQFLRKTELRLLAICITHAHVDHIGGVELIHKKSGAPVYLHRREQSPKMNDLDWILSINEDTAISIGQYRITARETPGHTAGGTTYCMTAADLPFPFAFVGDALFAGSIGRAQLPSTYPVLVRSVRNKILTLPKETVLFPGHGPLTSVQEERTHNPFFDFND